MIEHNRPRGDGIRHPVFDSERFARVQQSDTSRADALLTILATVIANGIAPTKEARLAWDRKQPAQAAHIVHNLKGCIANLGGMRVYELSGLLEIRLEIGADSAEVLQLLHDLEEELKTFIHTARTWMMTTRGAYAPEVTIEHEQRLLLTTYLLDSNILACDVFDSLEGELRSKMNPRDFEGLHRAMTNLNFAQALIHLSYSQSPRGF